MPNIQDPEMRRSGKDPLVQDSAKINPASSMPDGSGRGAQKTPPDQQSPYGPQPPAERRPDGDDPDA